MSGFQAAVDVAIVGAGPAGSTCALALKDSGLQVTLIDKSTFPRDKVCGDAIPARAEKVLRSIDPHLAAQLQDFPAKTSIRSCRVVAPNLKHFDFHFQTPGYCSARMDFDHFLVAAAATVPEVKMLTGNGLVALQGKAGDWHLQLANGDLLQSKFLVACDGAQSRLARQLTGFRMDPAHHCAAVRGYFSGIADLDAHRMEIHFVRGALPGYFWIFPLPGGKANVGFGMLGEQISAGKVNLREGLESIVGSAPGLAERFAGADRLSAVQGFGLPMGSRKVALSGDGFLLCGDAGSLVEPATGEGIGNAMLSGQLAAAHLQKALASGDWRAETLAAYDRELYGRIWSDLRRKYLAQQFLGQRPGWMNWLVGQANRPGPVRWLMKRVF